MPPRFKEFYKPVPTSREVRQRRLSHERQLRSLQREQVFMGKRLCFRTPQESETESEYEFTPSDTTEIISGLKSTKHDVRVSSLTSLSTRLEQPSEEVRNFIQDQGVELLIGFLNSTDADEKLQSLWCLTNIAAGEPGIAQTALAAVPYLLALLSSEDAEIQNQAIWAVGNLAAEGESARNQLFANGVLNPLVNVVMNTTDSTLLQTACFALSNMARMPNSYFNRLFDMDVPQSIARQLVQFKDDMGCVTELAWVCTYLTAASNSHQIDQIMATGAIETFLSCATKSSDIANTALIPIIRTLGNIAAGTDAQTHSLVSQEKFVQLLVRSIEKTSSRAIEKESLWVLSSVTAGSKADVNTMVNAGIITDLARIIEKQNFDLKKEAAYSLLNIAIVGQRISDLPNRDLVPEFVEFVNSQDVELVRMGIQYIALLFEQLPDRQGPELLRGVAGGIDALENQVAVTDDDNARSILSALIDDFYAEGSMM
ncbi:hypothetical protein H4R22_002960 [Coemansia sp. RSA 1290]|nr:hypothetical protein H4R22_002960 [Coemansia sp. RSA 1290]KAJ2649839.1 hypothetical protein IWW40_002850 [Coemansia sp. RSA 1250]